MDVLARVLVALNGVANALGEWLLAPIGLLPGWLSITAIAALTGVLLLVIFKYTSQQQAIKRVRDDITANLLTLKLFKESARATVEAQQGLLLGAGRLLVLALVPTLVMLVPVTLLLGQMSLWYQQRPLRVGEEAVVTMQLNGETDTQFPEVSLSPTNAVETTVGPVRVFSKREVCWNIKVRESGYHRLAFQVGGQAVDKELAVGDGFMRVSAQRPERVWSEDLVYYPAEQPFGPDSSVRSITIDYPRRQSLGSGNESWGLIWFVKAMKLADWLGNLFCGVPGWLVYWFLVSLIVAFCFRRVFRVNV
jgi:uncharacterized membrane protein (DUF106 family)